MISKISYEFDQYTVYLKFKDFIYETNFKVHVFELFYQDMQVELKMK